MQARLFNDPDSGYNVLVASDAVGMGLNLNIQRVIFQTLVKFIGKGLETVSISAVKQIAGRAGRRSSQYPEVTIETFVLHTGLEVPLQLTACQRHILTTCCNVLED